MRKIPTLFVRELPPAAGARRRAHVIPQVNPGCEWVLNGEGVATRKFDGHCVLVTRDGLATKAFSRREVKPGKNWPPRFYLTDRDDVTGKVVGWVPYEDGSFRALIDEALAAGPFAGPDGDAVWMPATYELVGPKVNGNPERFEQHRLVQHGMHTLEIEDVSFVGIRDWLAAFPLVEGIVWWHPDGHKAKIKQLDYIEAAELADRRAEALR